MFVSGKADRVWCIIHTELGLIALCAWYRPPRVGEEDTIRTLEE